MPPHFSRNRQAPKTILRLLPCAAKVAVFSIRPPFWCASGLREDVKMDLDDHSCAGAVVVLAYFLVGNDTPVFDSHGLPYSTSCMVAGTGMKDTMALPS